jgi:hypothetical protein
MTRSLTSTGEAADAALPPVACEHCGGRFLRKREWGKFCSDRCRAASHQLEQALRLISSHLIGVAEAARLGAVSASTIRRRVERGQLRARRCAGRLLIYRRDVSAGQEIGKADGEGLRLVAENEESGNE